MKTKITSEQRQEIIELDKKGVSRKEISSRFSITPGYISHIIKASIPAVDSTAGSVPPLSSEVVLQNFINILEEYLPKLKIARHKLESAAAIKQIGKKIVEMPD